MITYRDKTYCASPHCKNECGRQVTDEVLGASQRMGLDLSMGYLCGEPATHEEAKSAADKVMEKYAGALQNLASK